MVDGYEASSPYIPPSQPRGEESEAESIPDVPLETRAEQQSFKSQAQPAMEEGDKPKKGKGRGRGRGRSCGRGMKRPARRTENEKPEDCPGDEGDEVVEKEDKPEEVPVKEEGGKRKREKAAKSKAEPKVKAVKSGQGDDTVAEKSSSSKRKQKVMDQGNEKVGESKDGAELRLTFAGRRPPKTQCAHDRYLALQTIFLKRILPQLPPDTNLKGTAAEARFPRRET